MSNLITQKSKVYFVKPKMKLKVIQNYLEFQKILLCVHVIYFIFNLDELFPFKFELRNALITVLQQQKMNEFESYYFIANYLFTFQLLYINYTNKQKVNQFLKQTKREYYIYDVSNNAKDYLNTLTKEIHNLNTYGDEEFSDLLKSGTKNISHGKLLEFIISYIKQNYPNYRV